MGSRSDAEATKGRGDAANAALQGGSRSDRFPTTKIHQNPVFQNFEMALP